MLKRLVPLLTGLLAITACGAADDKAAETKSAPAAVEWKAGEHYKLVDPPQPTGTGDKIEVLEAFSYACSHCAHFQPYAEELKAKLPKQAQFGYMPIVFNPSWEPLARAFYTAESLGVLDKTHQALFDALHRDHQQLVTLDALAGFYAGFGVDPKNFISTAQSFVVEGRLSTSQARARAYPIESTPTLIVNGKYRLDASSAGGQPQAVELALWLVSKELAAKKGK